MNVYVICMNVCIGMSVCMFLACLCRYLCMTVYASTYICVCRCACICVYMDDFISLKIMRFSFSLIF